MKNDIDNLHLCTDDELYEDLLPLTEKIYNQYSYVNIEQSCYNKIVMDSIKESRKILNNSKIDTFDKLFLDCLQNNINEYIKTLLPNQAKEILLGFIETNIKPSNTYKEVIQEFQKLVDFIQNIDFPFLLDFFNIVSLFERYKFIEDMVKQIVDTNIENIKKSGIDNTFGNTVIASLAEVYCLTHNIEICDDKLIFDETENSCFDDYDDYDDYDSFVIYLREIRKYSLLSKEEEKKLFVKLAQGDKKARKKLIDSNLRLVVCIAKRFRESWLPFLDLIQEGNLGLIVAVDHFDITKGFRFSTYAGYWIKQKIRMAICGKSSCIRIPMYKYMQLKKYMELESNFICQLNRKPSIEEIAKQMNISVVEVSELQQMYINTVSINSLMFEDGDTELGDLISDVEANVEDICIKDIESAYIRNLIDGSYLNLAEIRVITLRYGLNGENPKTLREVGRMLNLTFQKVNQIEFKALKKLRIPLEKYVNNLDDEHMNKSTNGEYLPMSHKWKFDEQKINKESKVFESHRRKENILEVVYKYFADVCLKYTREQIDEAFNIVLNSDMMDYFFKEYINNSKIGSELDEVLKNKIEYHLIPEISRYLSTNGKDQQMLYKWKFDEQKINTDSKIFKSHIRKENILKVVYKYFASRCLRYTKKQIDRVFKTVLNGDAMDFLNDYINNFEISSELDEELKNKIEHHLIPEILIYLSNDERLDNKSEAKSDIVYKGYIKKINKYS